MLFVSPWMFYVPEGTDLGERCPHTHERKRERESGREKNAAEYPFFPSLSSFPSPPSITPPFFNIRMANFVQKLFKRCNILRQKRYRLYRPKPSNSPDTERSHQRRQTIIVIDCQETEQYDKVKFVAPAEEETKIEQGQDLLYQCIQNVFSGSMVLTMPESTENPPRCPYRRQHQQRQRKRWSTGMIDPALIINDPLEERRRSAHFVIRNMPPPTCGYHYLTSIPETSCLEAV